MDTNGSIKASGIKGSSFRPTQIEPALLATAKQFLENFQFDTRVRQMLHEEKMEQSVGKHTYYILGNEQKYEPGFLCIMKGHPIVFLHSRFQYGFALRMRVHASLYQKQALFIGTLDTVFATFRLEDVWYLNGKAYYTEPYSKRYDALQTFYSTMFVQDKHLSGFNVEVAKLSPLSDLRKIVDSKEFYSLDFVPEHGGRRRWHLPLAFTQQQKKIADAPFNAKGPEKTLVEAALLPVPTGQAKVETKVETKPPIDTKHTEAIARKIVGMPDTYSLQSKTNLDLGRGAVQTSGLSMLLRSEFTNKKRESVSVSIQWYEEFQRYKITGILEN
jgi:hypothetical protein